MRSLMEWKNPTPVSIMVPKRTMSQMARRSFDPIFPMMALAGISMLRTSG